jgi:hypothetical protein
MHFQWWNSVPNFFFLLVVGPTRRLQKQVWAKLSLLPSSDEFFLNLLFRPEDEGDVCLNSVWLSPDYTTLYPGRPYSSSHHQDNLISNEINGFFVSDVAGRVSSVAGMAHDPLGQGSLNISDVSKWTIVCLLMASVHSYLRYHFSLKYIVHCQAYQNAVVSRCQNMLS